VPRVAEFIASHRRVSSVNGAVRQTPKSVAPNTKKTRTRKIGPVKKKSPQKKGL